MKKVFLFIFAMCLSLMGMAMSLCVADSEPEDIVDESDWIDCTDKVVNPSFELGKSGWTINKGKIEVKGSGPYVITAYNYAVDICQVISGLDAGHYVVKVQACSRYMDGQRGIQDYVSRVENGQAIPNEAYVYANGVQKKVKNIYDESSTEYDFAELSKQKPEDLTMPNGGQIPYNSANFVDAFGAGMYENELECTVGKDGYMVIGIKNELSGMGYIPYIAYDNFRLYKVSDFTDEETSAIELYDLNAEEGDYVAVCMPYAVKSEYFGPVYKVGQIVDGTATLVPTEEVEAGEPCVIKYSGEINVNADVVQPEYSFPKTAFSLWNNTIMEGNFNTLSWTATSSNGNSIDLSDLVFLESDLSNMAFSCTIENYAVGRFWAENGNYSADSNSEVSKYIGLPAYSRTDQPNPVRIPVVASDKEQILSYSLDSDMQNVENIIVPAGVGVVDIYNLLPGCTYYYSTDDGLSGGKFTVEGSLRMMMIGNNVVNMRDLGGKKVMDADMVKYVRYGKLFRNAEFKGMNYNINDEEREMLNGLNIGAEIDLRNTDGNRPWLQNAVRDDNYYWAQSNIIEANGLGRIHEPAAKSHLKKEFEFVVNNLRKGVAVDIHCRIGADRTGLLSFMLLGLLGVNEADLMRDYETTSFSAAGLRTMDAGDGDEKAGTYKDLFPTEFRDKIPAEGTLRDVFEEYFVDTLKVDAALITEFRQIMLGTSPLPDAEADDALLIEAKEKAKLEIMPTLDDIENKAHIVVAFTSMIDEAKNVATVILRNDEFKAKLPNYKYVYINDKKYVLDKVTNGYAMYHDENLLFTDKDAYSSEQDFTVDSEITYQRTFTSNNWQSLYLPFAISYEEWADNFDVAAINNFHEYTNDEGKTVKTELEIRLVKGEGRTLKPNHPYLIRAKDVSAGDVTLALSRDKVYRSDANSIDCSSVDWKYTFKGTYQPITELYTKDYIFMSGGKLSKTKDDLDVLSPQRWYLTLESRGVQYDYNVNDNSNDNGNVKSLQIDIKLLDDNGATGIDDELYPVERSITRSKPSALNSNQYNLNGQVVNKYYKGIVINNGKKYYQR